MLIITTVLILLIVTLVWTKNRSQNNDIIRTPNHYITYYKCHECQQIEVYQVPNDLDIQSVSKEYIELLKKLASKEVHSEGTKRLLYELSAQMWLIQQFLQKGKLRVNTSFYET